MAPREKEKAIRRRFSERLEKSLGNLQKQVEEGRLQDRSKIERRLRKIQARHPRVADWYEMGVVEREGHRVVEWKRIEERRAWREAREGAYLLRTHLQGETAEELWEEYIQLTEAEAAFGALKTEWLVRPLFHQLEPRVKAHLLVAFLGYALGVTLKHLLRGQPSRTGRRPEPWRCWPPCRAPTSSCPPSRGERSVCAELPPPAPSNSASSINWV